MDNPARAAYRLAMFARVVTLLATLVIAAVTTATSAHAARMSIGPDHAGHGGMMMQAAQHNEPLCSDEPACGTADAGLCEFVCAGLTAFLPLQNSNARHDCMPETHELPGETIFASLTPGFDERPPKLALL